MGKPYYEIDVETKHIILELLKKCIALNLGNLSFHYFPTRTGTEETDFYLTEYKQYWELVVKQRWAKTTDIYRLNEDEIIYKFSEKD